VIFIQTTGLIRYVQATLARDTIGDMTEVTEIPNAITLGADNLASELLPLVYDLLRKLAAARLAHEDKEQ
jgi:hypothetical protein